MEISDALRSRILAEYNQCKPRLDECVANREFASKFAFFPIYIDGVIDQVRYNVEEGRFDQIAIRVATEGVVKWGMGMFGDWTAYCDKSEEVIVLLEEG